MPFRCFDRNFQGRGIDYFREAAQAGGGRASVAFIRKRGNAYYLVHSVRHEGRVEQIHLARLGPHPRINDEIIRGVTMKHPFVHVDWDRLREQASRQIVNPVEKDAQYLQRLIDEVRDFHLNIADIQLPYLDVAHDRELRSQLLTELKLLRGTLDVKLNSSRRNSLINLRGRLT
ncbi:MAG: hypothetical protein ACRD18_00520 [Terriglobia bacterium]